MNKRNEAFWGRRVLITGGTSGIGFALASQLSALDAHVIVCGRDPGRLADVATQLNVETVACDVSNREALLRLVDEVEDRLGGLDVLIHNAGVQREISLVDDTPHALTREIGVNLAGPIELTSLALPMLLSNPRRYPPTVVFITSVLATAPKASAPIYCASKAGLRSFAQALRYQLAPRGVRVLEVVPPVVDTAMTKGREVQKVSPDVVASAAIAGIADGREIVRVGQARLAQVLFRIAPGFFAQMMANK